MSMKFNEMEEQSGLHDQMIMDEILSRLPVKSLCRFKCVSKHWKAVISSHEFVKVHLRKQQELVSLPISNPKWVFFQQKQNSWLLNYEVYDHEEVSTLDKDHSGALISLDKVFDTQLINKADPESFGSSCGLVCMFDYEKGQLFLFNPSLRKWRLIPKPEPFSPENPMFWGFGYVSFIDDFKLILGFKDWSEAQSIMIFVFSLRNNSWRKVEGDHHFDTVAASHMYAKGILVNEHVHWWATPIDEKDHHNGGCIMAFDLVHETFEKIHVPLVLRSKVPNLFNSSDSNHISSKGGHLCLSVVREKNVEIWMLKQYRRWDSWVRLCDLHIPGSDEYCHQFLEFTKTGKFLMRCSMTPDGLNVSHVIFLVDQNQSTHKNNPIWSDGPISCIESYVESLVSPFGLATHGPTSM